MLSRKCEPVLTCEQARSQAIAILAAARNGDDAAAKREAGRNAITVRELGERFDKEHIAHFDWGARSADIIAALWPERCRGLVSVSGYLIGSQPAGRAPLPPEAEFQWCYQFYFATERGRAGYENVRREFAKLLWRLASPKRRSIRHTFDRSAAALDNPDHVAIVIHNYRRRQGLVDGEARYDALEQRLDETQAITVPASFRLIAKMPTIAAMAYKYTIGESFIYPENDLDLRVEFPAHVLRRAA